jgi:CRP-like cAMP-binding protein
VRPDPAAVLPSLLASPVLARMPGESVRRLAEMVREERFDAGETLWERGEPAGGVAVVASGRLEVFAASADRPARVLGPGELLGEYGMFGAGVRSATVRAAEPAVVYTLEYPRFRAFLESSPGALSVLLEVAVARLVEVEERLRRLGNED